MKLRGHLALLLIVGALTLSDLVQRLVIAPIVRLFPSRRIRVLTRWQKLMAATVLRPVAVIGGAAIPPLPKIPGGPGVLVVMNHQSLLDIPLVVSVLDGCYPRIVTRARYARGIPLISHMTRLYQYPVVDPTASRDEMRTAITGLREASSDSEVPLVIFPEGTRSRDGSIGRFRKSGLRAILASRAWTVWVVVIDGFWQRARLGDFLEGMAEIRGRVEVFGPYEWRDPEREPHDFIQSLRRRMVDELDAMRGAGVT